MSLRRSINKSPIGLRAEFRTGNEVPRVVVAPLKQIRKKTAVESPEKKPSGTVKKHETGKELSF
jgi:hypothetical protein